MYKTNTGCSARARAKPKGRAAQKLRKNQWKSAFLASRGPLGRPLRGLLGRLGGLLARLGAIFGVLERSLGVLGPSWTVLEASWRSVGPTSRPLGPEKVTRPDATSPRGFATRPGRIENLGSGPLNDPSGLRTEAQGMRQRTLGHAHSGTRHGGGYTHIPIRPPFG